MAKMKLIYVQLYDTINMFREIVNQNFETVSEYYNNLTDYFNINVPGGSLNIGELFIKKISNISEDVEIFKCEASGVILGNLKINKNLKVSNDVNIEGKCTIKDNFSIGEQSTSGNTTKYFNINSNININSGMLIDTQFATTVPVNAHIKNNNDGFLLNIENKRIVYLDYSNYSSTQQQHTNKILISINNAILGQRIILRIKNISDDLASSLNEIEILKNNFEDYYTNNIKIKFNGSTVQDKKNNIKKEFIEICCIGSETQKRWTIINSSKFVEY